MALLTRAIVIASTLAAVALGLWPLQAQPALAAALATTFVAVALLFVAIVWWIVRRGRRSSAA